ncbi:MAG: class I SAM-dependent methyltransferase [Gaiellales bacterium]
MNRCEQRGDVLDRSRYTEIAHRGIDFMGPYDARHLVELFRAAGPPAGARVLDLGCGNGALLSLLAERFGAGGVGIDRSPELIGAARRRAPAGVEFVVGDAAAYGGEPGSFDLAVSVGAVSTVTELAGWARPGGTVLLGAGYWRRPPDPAYLASLGAARDELADYAGTIAAGEAAGLVPLHTVTSTGADWDRYEWRWSLNGERYAAEHGGRPGVAEFLAWIRAGRRRYLELGGRQTLGFGLFAFANS